MLARGLLAISLALAPLPAATKLLVTVVEPKSGAPVSGLQAGDFSVLDDKTPRRVEQAEFSRDTLDIQLLVDTSLVGGAVRPLAEGFIGELQPKEQMGIVSFHSSADLIQDFTSSKELLLRSLAGVRYGNEPRVLDALFAAIDGGFPNTTFRRVILLLTAGMEGRSRTTERDVIRLARRNQVSIYPVYVSGYEKSLFELLARQTGGASFNLRDMAKAGSEAPPKRVFEALRGHYTLSVEGNLPPGEKLRVEVKRPEKLQVGAMPAE